MREIKDCEVCGNTSLERVLDLGAHPMCDDLVPLGDTRQCREYPIDILFCDTCLTAHQRFQIPKQDLFPRDYHYRARFTADVLKGMRELVDSVEAHHGSVKGKKVLDIGCNDGSLLSIFKEKGALTFGIEPTGAYKEAQEAGHDVVNAFFDEKAATDFVAAHGKADIITFTNVFAHIEDLPAVIRALNIAMHDQSIIVIENHYLGAVLAHFQFDTFYHEHPRTYSYTSFARIGDALGMRIGHVEFPERYKGNIRVIYVRDGEKTHAGWSDIHPRETSFGQGLKRMSAQLGLWRQKKRSEIDSAVKTHGPLRAKAFPGRAAIPVKLLGLGAEQVKEVYEKPGSAKIGHYVPGTRIPIVSDDAFDLNDEKPIINMAWHISKEIQAYMRSRGFKGPFIDIIAPEDLETDSDAA